MIQIKRLDRPGVFEIPDAGVFVRSDRPDEIHRAGMAVGENMIGAGGMGFVRADGRGEIAGVKQQSPGRGIRESDVISNHLK